MKNVNNVVSTPLKAEPQKNDVLSGVFASYSQELNAKQEEHFNATMKLLDVKGVTDQVVRARILSKQKAFTRDVYIAFVDSLPEQKIVKSLSK